MPAAQPELSRADRHLLCHRDGGGSQSIYLGENRRLVAFLYENDLAFAPLTFWLGTVMAVLCWLLLRYTLAG